ncbi:hypothetical protein ES703_58287 [subsurface metagenome]
MEELGGGRVTRVEEPVFAGANGALKMAQRMPRHFWKVLRGDNEVVVGNRRTRVGKGV